MEEENKLEELEEPVDALTVKIDDNEFIKRAKKEEELSDKKYKDIRAQAKRNEKDFFGRQYKKGDTGEEQEEDTKESDALS